jgi:hypothetical protein
MRYAAEGVLLAVFSNTGSILRRGRSEGHKRLPQPKQSGTVESEHLDGCPTDRSKTDNGRGIRIPGKVLPPAMLAGMKDRYRPIGNRIARGNPGIFVIVTALTGEARFSSVDVPPRLRGRMCSTESASGANRSGIRQYSQHPSARATTARRTADLPPPG